MTCVVRWYDSGGCCVNRILVTAFLFFWSLDAAAQVPEILEDLLAGSDVVKMVDARIKNDGVAGMPTTVKPHVINLDEAVRRAIADNLELQAEQFSAKASQSAIEISDGVFDTRFSLRAGRTRSRFLERSAIITRQRETETTVAGAGNNDDFAASQTTEAVINDPDAQSENDLGRLTCVYVDGELVNPDYCSVRTESTSVREFASLKSSVTPEASVFALEALQVFPWGSTLSAKLQSTRRLKSGYSTLDRLERVSGSNSDPIGNGSNYPWTSSLFINLNTPVPFSRNFGSQSFGPQVNTELARLDHKIGKWRLAQRSNEVLYQVAEAYWRLVASQYQLNVANNRRQTTGQMVIRGRRLYEAQSITSYDMAQLDVELERSVYQLEVAWQDFLAASNLLVELLGMDSNSLLIAGVELKDLLELKGMPNIDAVKFADSHPQVVVATLEFQKHRMLSRYYASYHRPDVNLVVNYNYQQSDRVFGYKTWNDSYEHVFDPDEREKYVGLSYTYAFGKRAEKAAWSRSRTEQQQAELQILLTRNQVRQEFQDALVAQASTGNRLQQLRAGLDLVREAYRRSIRMREQNMLTEFERLTTQQSLYRSVTDYLLAAVTAQREQARFLYAAGQLTDRYVHQNAKELP